MLDVTLYWLEIEDKDILLLLFLDFWLQLIHCDLPLCFFIWKGTILGVTGRLTNIGSFYCGVCSKGIIHFSVMA